MYCFKAKYLNYKGSKETNENYNLYEFTVNHQFYCEKVISQKQKFKKKNNFSNYRSMICASFVGLINLIREKQEPFIMSMRMIHHELAKLH